MIGSLVWKEYREQRSVWLALTLLGSLALFVLLQVFAPHGASGLQGEKLFAVVLVALAAAGTYGLVCGAMMLANESESRVLPFLETLPALRPHLWRTKFAVGLYFTAVQGLLLAFVVHGLGLADHPQLPAGWHWALPLVGVEAFAFGMFGSALAGSVLGAILWAVFPLGLVWAFGGFADWPPHPIFVIARLLLAGAAVGVSWLAFGGADLGRRGRVVLPARAKLTSGWDPVAVADAASVGGGPSADAGSVGHGGRWRAWKVLVWLTLRQGWFVMLALTAAAAVLGLLVTDGRLYFWLWATLLIGIVCGVASFAGDQGAGACRFLGDQRFPVGRVWAVKTTVWLIVALGTAVLLTVGLALNAATHGVPSHHPRHQPTLFGSPTMLHGENGLAFLALWLPHSFAVGQLCSLAWRKSAVAFVMALALSVAAAAVWLPSLCCGGVYWWQVLVVPALLLAAGRAAMWPWATERLRGAPLGVGAALLVGGVGLWVAGNFVYRVAEVPDVGEPYDLAAFVAGLPKRIPDEAGRLVRDAADQLAAREKEAEPLDVPVAREGAAPGMPGGAGPARLSVHDKLLLLLERGWTADAAELGAWLDQMFEGEWVETLRKAAALPLGMVEDPRELRLDTPLPRLDAYGRAGLLLAARAVQRQAAGDSAGALDHIVLALNLSRHVRHRANQIHSVQGRIIESHALRAFEFWLHGAGPNVVALKRALHELGRHERERPGCTEALQVDYLICRMAVETPAGALAAFRAFSPRDGSDGELLALSLQTPWERARAVRLLNLLYLARLNQLRANLPGIVQGPADALRTVQAEIEERVVTGQWERTLHHSPLFWLSLPHAVGFADVEAAVLTRLRAARLRVALVLYQLREGRPAAALPDLLREELTELPDDPFSGQPFRYRVSPGEKIEALRRTDSEETAGVLDVRPGQGVLWSVGPDKVDHQGLRQADVFLVNRMPPHGWLSRRLDLVFLVPGVER